VGVPEVDKGRYHSIQFVDLYTYNFAYLGTRTSGNGAEKFLLAGPNWKGNAPKGITKVIRSDTEFVLAGYRTQLFNPADIDNVKKIQAGYTVQPLSQFLGQAAPPAPPKVDFPAFSIEKTKTLAFFDYLNFLLQFCPTVSEDEAARASFAKIGIEPGKQFNPDTPDTRRVVEAGMVEGLKAIEASVASTKSAAHMFGTRAFLKNNYLNRATGAMAGIYGNSEDEAFYFAFYKDTAGAPLDGSANRYTMHFAKGQFPPVNAFWSVTLYDAKTKLLSANAINRYLINSPMLPNMKLDGDGGLTIYIQKNSPGKDKEANWLPAPDAEFFLQFRCYWPKPAILEGKWAPQEPARVT
jgi:hypothetical protein